MSQQWFAGLDFGSLLQGSLLEPEAEPEAEPHVRLHTEPEVEPEAEPEAKPEVKPARGGTRREVGGRVR